MAIGFRVSVLPNRPKKLPGWGVHPMAAKPGCTAGQERALRAQRLVDGKSLPGARGLGRPRSGSVGSGSKGSARKLPRDSSPLGVWVLNISPPVTLAD
jgi:hypothetical protein